MNERHGALAHRARPELRLRYIALFIFADLAGPILSAFGAV